MRGRASAVGETKVSPNGYHYTRTETGWELTGRLIAAKNIGRKLRRDEQVRYFDGNRNNLSPDNITVRKVTAVTPDKRLARLEDKLREIQAQIDDCKEEIRQRDLAKELSSH